MSVPILDLEPRVDASSPFSMSLRNLSQGITDPESEQTGVVHSLHPFGMATVHLPEETHLYSFSFDRIEGYMGEYPDEIGLTPGVTVRFTLAPDGKSITRVRLPRR